MSKEQIDGRLRPALPLSDAAARRDTSAPHGVPAVRRLEQAEVPLHLVTLDLVAGEEMRLSEGPALAAVLAAAAIPGLLPPVRWGERLLVDGGVVGNTPISHAVKLGTRRIYVLSTQDPSDRALAQPTRGAVEAAIHAFTLMTQARLEPDHARHGSDAEPIVLPAANPVRVQATDFEHAGQRSSMRLVIALARRRKPASSRAAAAPAALSLPVSDKGSHANAVTDDARTNTKAGLDRRKATAPSWSPSLACESRHADVAIGACENGPADGRPGRARSIVRSGRRAP